MLFSQYAKQMRRFHPVYLLVWFAILLFSPLKTLAQTSDGSDVSTVPAAPFSVPTASSVLENVASQIPSLMRLVTAIAYVIGMYLIFYGILKLKQYGEMRTQMMHERHLQGSIMLVVTGSMLLYLPTSVQVGLSTFWSQPSPYGYLTQTSAWGDFLDDVFMVVQLFGTIAFIRGLVMLSHLSGQGHQGGLGKGLTHVIGGLLCINIYQLIQVVMITMGVQINY